VRLSFILALAIAGSVSATVRCAAEPDAAPRVIELTDQYGKMRRISFPATNLQIVLIADQKGSRQLEGWIAGLREYARNGADLVGIANLEKVPSFLRERIRRRFRESQRYPVLMDWTGAVCSGFRCEADAVTVFVVGRDGVVTGRFVGSATDEKLRQAYQLLGGSAEGETPLER
jgi:hypothetical protein